MLSALHIVALNETRRVRSVGQLLFMLCAAVLSSTSLFSGLPTPVLLPPMLLLQSTITHDRSSLLHPPYRLPSHHVGRENSLRPHPRHADGRDFWRSAPRCPAPFLSLFAARLKTRPSETNETPTHFCALFACMYNISVYHFYFLLLFQILFSYFIFLSFFPHFRYFVYFGMFVFLFPTPGVCLLSLALCSHI